MGSARGQAKVCTASSIGRNTIPFPHSTTSAPTFHPSCSISSKGSCTRIRTAAGPARPGFSPFSPPTNPFPDSRSGRSAPRSVASREAPEFSRRRACRVHRRRPIRRSPRCAFDAAIRPPERRWAVHPTTSSRFRSTTPPRLSASRPHRGECRRTLPWRSRSWRRRGGDVSLR